MRILHIITALGIGGAEKLLVGACPLLAERDEIAIAYLRDKRELAENARQAGAEVVYIPYEERGFLGTIRELKKLIARFHPQIVHTHLPLADTLGRIAALASPGVTVVSSIHNMDLWKLEKTPQSTALRLFNRLTVNCFKRASLIAVSRSVMEFCVEREHIKREKLTVIPNYVEFDAPNKRLEKFVPPFDRERHFVILCVARLASNKGQRHIILALDRLVRQPGYERARLVLVGEGEERGALEALVSEKGLGDYVVLTGLRENVFDYMDSAHLHVLASANEGFGIVVLEAFYCALPVLASDTPPVMELIGDGERGMSFKYGDVEGLAARIKDFMDGRVDTGKMTAAALEFSAGFTKKRQTELLEQYYERILEEGRL